MFQLWYVALRQLCAGQGRHQSDMGDSQQFVLLPNARALDAYTFTTKKVQAKHLLEN
jgi:hypothetical protein